MKFKTLIVCLCFSAVNWCRAEEPDFYIMFEECSTTIASMADSEFPLKTLPGDPATYRCVRKGRSFKCTVSFRNGAKSILGDILDYDLVFESGAQFDIKLGGGGGDYISINRNAHTAAIVTRTLAANHLGAKVCRGSFVTADELEFLKKIQK